MGLPQKTTVYKVKGQGVENLKQVEEPLQEPSADEVVVQVKSVSLNSRDLQVVMGTYPPGAKPDVIPGSDMAGEVVAVGSSVVEVQVGDTVISNFRGMDVWNSAGGLKNSLGGDMDGTLREYATLPKDAVNKFNKPKDMTWGEAASLTCTGVTVWNALFGLRRLTPGDVVLMIGTGGVSLTALSIAKAAGAKTIITSSSDEKLAMIKKKYGADYTINYKTNPEWHKKALEFTNNKGVDYILETGGSGTITESINSIAGDGIIAVIGYMAPLPDQYPEVFLNTLIHGAILRGVQVGGKQHAQELIKFVENKGMRIHVHKVFNYHKNGVPEAFELLKTNEQVGKVCIDFD